MLERINEYLDAAPRSAAEPEAVGKFTLFRHTGPWPYYGRPRLDLVDLIARVDVDALRSRQRALELPENIEWVVEITPSLEEAAAASGLAVETFPLMVLDPAAHAAAPHPHGIAIRLLSPDDPDFARGHAVAHVGFGAPGTALGREGPRERDENAATTSAATIDFLNTRARSGLSISYAAFDEDGPVCVGTHQPVGGVTEIVGVATLPSARRRGLGVAVTAALVADAHARGVETVFLSAGSEDVARIYERVGFRRIGRVGSAEPGPQR